MTGADPGAKSKLASLGRAARRFGSTAPVAGQPEEPCPKSLASLLAHARIGSLKQFLSGSV